jgi:phenylpyruvate tautomerase PptA (4-oxalocrotonate tautomerase family)
MKRREFIVATAAVAIAPASAIEFTIEGGASTMPDTLVEVRGNWLGDRKGAFIEAIRQAEMEALRLPPEDRVIRLIAHDEDDFLLPGGHGQRFTRIEITMFSGRSPSTKRKLYRAIVERLAAFDIPGNDIKVMVIDVPLSNWGIRGGKSADEFTWNHLDS